MRLLLLIPIAILAGCARGPESAPVRASTVSGAVESGDPARIRFAPGSAQLRQIRVAEATSVEVPQDEVVAPGRLQLDPGRVSRISMPVPGRVVAVNVRLGDSVERGQSVFEIESPEVEAAVADAHRAEGAQNQASAALNKSRSDASRANDLFRHGAVPKKDVVDAETELARAESAVKEAAAGVEQARRRLAIFGLKPGQFGQRIAVKAPISGKILEISVVPGEYRNDTTAPLVTVADLSTLWVVSGVPENSIRNIHPGEQVSIDLTAFPGEVLRGRVMRIADAVDPATRVVDVRTELANPGGRFRPEMYARIRHSHGSKKAAAVAASAVFQSGGRSWVFKESAPGEFERVPVVAADANGPAVPIYSGVQPGDRVVVDGAMLLAGSAGGRP